MSALPPGPPPRHVNTVSVDQFASFGERIDVRSPSEFADDHLPGAVNLPVVTVDVGDTADLIGATDGCHLVPREIEAIATKIVEVCRRGTRTRGCEWIARLSMENVATQIVEIYARVARD